MTAKPVSLFCTIETLTEASGSWTIMHRKFVKTSSLVLIILLLTLSACGQKGQLYLPDGKQAASENSASPA